MQFPMQAVKGHVHEAVRPLHRSLSLFCATNARKQRLSGSPNWLSKIGETGAVSLRVQFLDSSARPVVEGLQNVP